MMVSSRSVGPLLTDNGGVHCKLQTKQPGRPTSLVELGCTLLGVNVHTDVIGIGGLPHRVAIAALVPYKMIRGLCCLWPSLE